MASLPAISIVSTGRLRASLSLLLPPEEVYAATTGLSDHPEVFSEELRSALRSTQLRLLRQRIANGIRDLISRRRNEPDLLPGIRSQSSDAGLSLILHVGLGLTAEQLVDLLGSTMTHVARDLLDVRLRLIGKPDHSCKIFLDTLGRYRDGLSDLSVAASLSHHRVRCASCHVLLQQFEHLDQQILNQIETAERAAVASAPVKRSIAQQMAGSAPLALVTALLVGGLMVTSGLADNFIGGGATPLYAHSNPTEPGENGWILLGTWDGGLQAFDPVSGHRHTLREENYDASLRNGANFLLSPSGERVAIFAQNPVVGLHWATRHIEVVSITGEPISEISWQHSVDAGWPTGWLNDYELMIISIPDYQGGESPEQFLQRLEDESSLRAVDIDTGEQRPLFNGAVAQVIASPDGRRLAMVRPRDPTEPGTTVDVWEIDNNEIGKHITTVEHRFTWDGGLQWSPSGQHLYLGYISDYSERSDDGTTPARDGEFRGQLTSVDILRVDRDGEQEIFTDSEHMTGARIVGVTKGEEAFYATYSLEDGEDKQIWRRHSDSGESVPLETPGGAEGIRLHHQRTESGVLGYPTGFLLQPDNAGFLLQLGGDLYLQGDPTYHAEPPQATYLTVFNDQRNPSIVSVLSSRWKVYPLRWVSSDEISIETDSDLAAPFGPTEPERVGELRAYAKLGRESALSPDGTAITMEEPVQHTERPYLWYPNVQTGRWIAQRTRDLTWFADGHAVLGITEMRNDASRVSRVTLHSANQRGGSSVDAFLDPAELGDRDQIRYALPMTSTDGRRTTFYTVDPERNRADLWIAAWGQNTRSVHRFRYSSRTERLAPLAGSWIDDRTFLFTDVIEWSADGLPERSAIKRLTLNDDGEPDIDQLLTVIARGRDRGVAIREFAVDPTGRYLAFRQRHFTSRDNADEGYDTIHVATTDDIGQALEIRRGAQNAGLVWSPSGHMLAVANDDRIGVYSVDSHSFQFITNLDRRATYPNWVSDRDLWFNVGSGSSREVYRVMFQ